MVFNATINNISAISCRSVLLLEETGVPGENHRPAASQLYYIIVFYRVHLATNRFELTNLVDRRTKTNKKTKTNDEHLIILFNKTSTSLRIIDHLNIFRWSLSNLEEAPIFYVTAIVMFFSFKKCSVARYNFTKINRLRVLQDIYKSLNSNTFCLYFEIQLFHIRAIVLLAPEI
jgi:hypothetical protein